MNSIFEIWADPGLEYYRRSKVRASEGIWCVGCADTYCNMCHFWCAEAVSLQPWEGNSRWRIFDLLEWMYLSQTSFSMSQNERPAADARNPACKGNSPSYIFCEKKLSCLFGVANNHSHSTPHIIHHPKATLIWPGRLWYLFSDPFLKGRPSDGFAVWHVLC
jgi:hypothetical protein